MDLAVDAVRELEQLGTPKLMPSHAVSLWFAGPLVRRLIAAAVPTLGELVALCNERGSSWWRRVPTVGPVAAAEVADVLQRHQATLGKLGAHVHGGDATGAVRWQPAARSQAPARLRHSKPCVCRNPSMEARARIVRKGAPDFDHLMEQAGSTAARYRGRARFEIGEQFGEGYADKNPAFVAAYADSRRGYLRHGNCQDNWRSVGGSRRQPTRYCPGFVCGHIRYILLRRMKC
ncbi:hypothetical protein FX016_23305 [Cupriavidus gilardii]|nr:hypothetical protein FX016_23305 [Cupriavidus gilardii]